MLKIEDDKEVLIVIMTAHSVELMVISIFPHSTHTSDLMCSIVFLVPLMFSFLLGIEGYTYPSPTPVLTKMQM